jgi:hypothetical protein
VITTLAVWMVALPAAAGYGRLIVPRSERDTVESETARAYAGLLVLSAILLVIAFFANLTAWWGVIAVIPGIALSLRGRSLKSLPFSLCAIYSCVALFVSLREVNFYDTALYHQQAVKWLAEHGLVRGLALVYFRFGWTSSWFALAAPLNHGVLAGRAAAVVGGLPFALVVVSTLRILRRLVSEPTIRMSSAAWAILGGLLATVAIVWSMDASLSPDLMIWLEPLIIVTLLADPAVPEADRVGRAALVAALVCLVKLTSAPALAYCGVLLAWRFARHAEDRRKLAAYAAPAILATAVLLAANIVSSGCPLFPSPLGCTSTAWSVGSNTAATIQAAIREFARTSRHNQILPLTLVAALASAVCLMHSRTSFVRHCLSISWIGIAFTLTVAPVPRYSLGYFFLPVAAAGAIVLDRLALRLKGLREELLPIMHRVLQRRAAFAVTAAAAVPLFVHTPAKIDALLYPRRMASVSGDPIHVVNRAVDKNGTLLLAQESHGGLTVWAPASSDQCWDAPLPCTPTLTRDAVSPRRLGSFDKGFISPLK